MLMPLLALVYCVVLFLLLNKLSQLIIDLVLWLSGWIGELWAAELGQRIRDICLQASTVVTLVLFNTLALLLFVILKKLLNVFFKRMAIRPDSLAEAIVSWFYTYDEEDNAWYVRPELGQGRTFLLLFFFAAGAQNAQAGRQRKHGGNTHIFIHSHSPLLPLTTGKFIYLPVSIFYQKQFKSATGRPILLYCIKFTHFITA